MMNVVFTEDRQKCGWAALHSSSSSSYRATIATISVWKNNCFIKLFLDFLPKGGGGTIKFFYITFHRYIKFWDIRRQSPSTSFVIGYNLAITPWTIWNKVVKQKSQDKFIFGTVFLWENNSCRPFQLSSHSDLFLDLSKNGAPCRFSGRFEDGSFSMKTKMKICFNPHWRMRMWRIQIFSICEVWRIFFFQIW